jgi:hypothetical protein
MAQSLFSVLGLHLSKGFQDSPISHGEIRHNQEMFLKKGLALNSRKRAACNTYLSSRGQGRGTDNLQLPFNPNLLYYEPILI